MVTHTTESPSASEHDREFAIQLASRCAGKGWIEFDALVAKLDCKRSKISQALRWLRHESKVHIVETKVGSTTAAFRISVVVADEKQVRQLTADLLPQLVKLYAALKHTSRERSNLAMDVHAIVDRMSAHLKDREFDRQYNRIVKRIQRRNAVISGSPQAARLTSELLPVAPSAVAPSARVRPSSSLRKPISIIGVVVLLAILLIAALAMALNAGHRVVGNYVERIVKVSSGELQ